MFFLHELQFIPAAPPHVVEWIQGHCAVSQDFQQVVVRLTISILLISTVRDEASHTLAFRLLPTKIYLDDSEVPCSYNTARNYKIQPRNSNDQTAFPQNIQLLLPDSLNILYQLLSPL